VKRLEISCQQSPSDRYDTAIRLSPTSTSAGIHGPRLIGLTALYRGTALYSSQPSSLTPSRFVDLTPGMVLTRFSCRIAITHKKTLERFRSPPVRQSGHQPHPSSSSPAIQSHQFNTELEPST